MRRLIFIILIFSLCCGKKGRLTLPEKRLPFRVCFMESEIRYGRVFIKGKIVGKEERFKLSDIIGCRVYYEKYSFENPPCVLCPKYYIKFKEVKGKVSEGRLFMCELPWIKKRGIYYIKVRLLGKGNAIGPDSEEVRIEIPYDL